MIFPQISKHPRFLCSFGGIRVLLSLKKRFGAEYFKYCFILFLTKMIMGSFVGELFYKKH